MIIMVFWGLLIFIIVNAMFVALAISIFILLLEDGSLSIFGLFGTAIKIRTSSCSYSSEIPAFY
jgi:hypothetical protein